MIYVDGNIKECHSIILSITIDYEKEMVIISIRLNMQRLIYHISLEKYKNLCKIWTLKTHEGMQVYFIIQNTDKWIEEYNLRYEEYIHSIENIALNYLFVNKHKCIMLDILYSLLIRMVRGIYLFQWLKIIIKAKFTRTCVKFGITKSL